MTDRNGINSARDAVIGSTENAHRAMEAHGGRVRAGNRAGGGLVVEIRLPLD